MMEDWFKGFPSLSACAGDAGRFSARSSRWPGCATTAALPRFVVHYLSF